MGKVYVSASYMSLKYAIDRLNERQSSGSVPPKLYPNVNNGLEEKVENDRNLFLNNLCKRRGEKNG